MTQQELADRTYVTRQTVVAIESDKYSPSLEVAFRIAHVFNVPLEQVFQYTPPRARASDSRLLVSTAEWYFKDGALGRRRVRGKGLRPS